MGQAYKRFRAQAGTVCCATGHCATVVITVTGVIRCFIGKNNQLEVLPHEPHYQSSHYNRDHGGFNRHFRAWFADYAEKSGLTEIIRWSTQQFSRSPVDLWRIQTHQFRIAGLGDKAGRPTKGVHKGSGIHPIMMMDRHNVSGGVSHIYDNEMRPLGEGTLEQAGDLVLVNDHAVYHTA